MISFQVRKNKSTKKLDLSKTSLQGAGAFSWNRYKSITAGNKIIEETSASKTGRDSESVSNFKGIDKNVKEVVVHQTQTNSPEKPSLTLKTDLYTAKLQKSKLSQKENEITITGRLQRQSFFL